MPVDPMRDDGEEIQGSHRVHGSETGKNFSINPRRNTWHCFRCESGGGPLEWIAVESGLISCSEAGPGCLRGERFKEVVDLAKQRGFDVSIKRQRGTFQLIKERTITDKLPEDLPPNPIIILEAPPRSGKTHWSIRQLLKAKSGNYITHKHSIVAHAIEIFRKEGGNSAVWLEGKSRAEMCIRDNQDCRSCELYPNQHDDNHISYIDYETRSEKLLREHKILTKAEIPSNLCPYYTLRLAEKSADFCFSVVSLIEKIEPRKLTVLDEDPTLNFFYPASMELLRFRKARDEYIIKNNLGTRLNRFVG